MLGHEFKWLADKAARASAERDVRKYMKACDDLAMEYARINLDRAHSDGLLSIQASSLIAKDQDAAKLRNQVAAYQKDVQGYRLKIVSLESALDRSANDLKKLTNTDEITQNVLRLQAQLTAQQTHNREQSEILTRYSDQADSYRAQVQDLQIKLTRCPDPDDYERMKAELLLWQTRALDSGWVDPEIARKLREEQRAKLREQYPGKSDEEIEYMADTGERFRNLELD